MVQIAHKTQMDSWGGGEDILFRGVLEGKSSRREIGIYVSGKDILELAEKTKVAGNVGHALWHIQNPQDNFPCSACKGKEVK